MSVINQMLRDLDRRQAPGLEPAIRSGTAAVLAHRVPAVAASPGRSNGARTLGVVVVVGALVGLAAMVWSWRHAPPPKALPLGVPATVAPAPVAQVAVQADAQPAAASVASVASVSPLAASTASTASSGPLRAEPVRTQRAELPSSTAMADPSGLRLKASVGIALTSPSPSPSPSPAAAAAAAAAAASTPPGPAVSAPPRSRVPDGAVQTPDDARQRHAVAEALSLAQAQFSAGAPDAAIHIVQEALQTAERTKAPAALRWSLVREWARMELAQGRPATTLEVLDRWESLLDGQADGWALRANAAQRVGQHAQALQYYAAALQGRPTEQRWLLGSAVSSAALGQLDAAGDFTDRARSVGAVNPELLNYLRQQGVRVTARP
ncbi:MAG: hypothetical protein QE265_12945 [Rhodoferax sp.]|nr:hypothetical protein [Rhodoferax sp.]